MPLSLRSRALLLTGLSLALGAVVIGIAAASDHQDTPEVELNPLSDMTDLLSSPARPPAGSCW